MKHAFDENYFSRRAYYAYRSELRHVVQNLFREVLQAASTKISVDLFNGKGKKALDVGCAFGYVAELLAGLKYNVVGLDISSYALRRAKEGSASLDLVSADGCYVPFKSNTFSLITCFEVLEHIAAQELFVGEMETALKEGGACIWTTPIRNRLRKPYDLFRSERTHANILNMKEAKGMMSKYFRQNVVWTDLLLPIPPQIFNKYYRVQHTPAFASTGMTIVSVKT